MNPKKPEPQFDWTCLRTVSLNNLEAMCERTQRNDYGNNSFTMGDRTKNRVPVYKNQTIFDEHGYCAGTYTVTYHLPILPVPFKDSVALDPVRITSDIPRKYRFSYDEGFLYDEFCHNLQTMPRLWRDPETGEWKQCGRA